VLGESWADQYRRLKRQHALLKKTADSYGEREQLHESEYGRDILFHFCCDAFHLKDWIKNDNTLPQTVRDAVNKFIDKKTNEDPLSPALAACADIAIGVKHHEQRRGSYTRGQSAEVVQQSAAITLPFTFPARFANRWTVDVGGRPWDGLELAASAVDDWETWLTDHGVPLPT
jgi:hypothetical protein